MNTIYTSTNGILSIETSSGFMMLRTYDVRHGRSSRLYISADHLASWLFDEERCTGSFMEKDCENCITVYRANHGMLRVHLTWISVNGYGDLSGYIQRFTLPENMMIEALNNGSRIKKLIDLGEQPGQASITITNGAHRQIRAMDKLYRRALSKAMRRCFMWKGAHVCLYADWGNDFAFVDETSCGGLCLHESSVTGSNGKRYPKLSYGVHT